MLTISTKRSLCDCKYVVCVIIISDVEDNGEIQSQHSFDDLSAVSSPSSSQPHSSSHQHVRSDKSRRRQHRTSRPCLYCKTMQTNLARHLCTVHRMESEVASALKLPAKQRNVILTSIRKRGMMKYNEQLMANKGKDNHEVYQRERASRSAKDNLVICSACKGCFSSTYFFRHRIKCSDTSGSVPTKMPVSVLSVRYSELPEQFKTDILAKFANDNIGKVCKNDSCIIQFGARQYEKIKQKPDKAYEVKKSVMQDMRRLAHLFTEFKRQCASSQMTEPTSAADMLKRSTFDILRESIIKYTAADTEDMKAGLKHHVYYLLVKFSKFQKVTYLVQERDVEAKEVDNFKEILDLNSKDLLGDALYKLHKNRQICLRKPQELPSEDDVTKVKEYTVNRISVILSDKLSSWDPQRYAELRDLVVSRLTLFNARRGGEPARLLLTEWKDGEKGVWFDSHRMQKLDDADARLFSEMKLTYQSGKGDQRLVPVLLPKDVIEALEVLADLDIREQANVLDSNIFIFPATHRSALHVNGWNAVNRVCKAASIDDPTKMTATKQRHRVSTLYASLDVKEQERSTFYQHLGHTAEINNNVYQAPLAEKEIRAVGSHILAMDKQHTTTCSMLYFHLEYCNVIC